MRVCTEPLRTGNDTTRPLRCHAGCRICQEGWRAKLGHWVQVLTVADVHQRARQARAMLVAGRAGLTSSAAQTGTRGLDMTVQATKWHLNSQIPHRSFDHPAVFVSFESLESLSTWSLRLHFSHHLLLLSTLSLEKKNKERWKMQVSEWSVHLCHPPTPSITAPGASNKFCDVSRLKQSLW
jgi:hypothetical protein